MTIRELKREIDEYLNGTDGDINEDTRVFVEVGSKDVPITDIGYAQHDEDNNELVLFFRV